MSPSIVIVDYQPSWPSDFARLAATIRAELGDLALQINHIGSTSVTGLAAKDVIDIQVTVAEVDHPGIEPAMLRAGAFPTDIDRDHEPAGMTIDEAELRKRVFYYDAPSRRANVHIREPGRFNQQYALLCRDYLRAHPDAAAAYAAIKRALARHFADDVDAYYDVKDPTFDLFMSGARDWADWTNWVAPASDG